MFWSDVSMSVGPGGLRPREPDSGWPPPLDSPVTLFHPLDHATHIIVQAPFGEGCVARRELLHGTGYGGRRWTHQFIVGVADGALIPELRSSFDKPPEHGFGSRSQRHHRSIRRVAQPRP